jgi:restriction system protein
MARGGSYSQWQRQMAAERREAERREKERQRQAKEREKAAKERYLASRQHEAEAKTAESERQIVVLDDILTSVLPLTPLTFGALKATQSLPRFDGGALALPRPAPDWSTFAPIEPTGMSRLLGGRARHTRQVAEARERFEVATRRHQEEEAQRKQALAAAQAAYAKKFAEEQERIRRQNADVHARQAAFAAGDPEAVEWFVACVLDRSRYPSRFPHEYQVAYRPENRDVVVEFEFPAKDLIPKVRSYQYVKVRDEVKPVPRPDKEIKERYKLLIARVALRTLHEIFTATPAEVVEAVVFNGRVSTTDRATGKPARPHLLSVSAERSMFQDLVLKAVDPAACLTRLNALVSPNPFDMEAVEPFIAFDLKRFRFTDDLDVVAGLDSRPNLLKLSPTEFEHLVKQLFQAMGAEAWTTIPSKDGGVDAVATSKHLFFGGVCLIQAKRWTGLVGLESVHALTGVMADHNATTGVLVTTSWFGRASEQFAKRNRITLINSSS